MKKRVNKLLAMALAIIMVASLAGCNSSTKDNNANNGNTTISRDANEIMGNKNSLDETKQEDEEVDLNEITGDENSSAKSDDTTIDTSEILSSICVFKIIDCGQAESILISSKEFAVLIDAGEQTNATAIRKVLDNQGISKLDILVATHPHSDHIGGMKTIVENYDIDKIIMTPTGHTSQTYENLLIAIDSKGKTITKAEAGKEYSLGELKLKIIGPSELTGDLNEDSVVILASYGDIDVLLTGDAGLQSEKSYVKALNDIEVLKVGHHGSETATSDNLLDTTTPEIAAISCGANNQYGHPNQETIDKLKNRGIQIFTTETSGDIMVRTNGKEYTIETSKDGKVITAGNKENDTEENSNNNTSNNQNNTNSGSTDIVYVTEKGSKYHYTDKCSRLFTSKNILESVEKEEINKGLEKCSKCW